MLRRNPLKTATDFAVTPLLNSWAHASNLPNRIIALDDPVKKLSGISCFGDISNCFFRNYP